MFLPVLSFNVFFWFNALDVDKYAENRDNNIIIHIFKIEIIRCHYFRKDE